MPVFDHLRSEQWGLTYPVLAPCADAGHEKGRVDSSAKKSSAMRRFRIVVVEDEPFVRLNIEQILTDAGHEVVGMAQTAADAVSVVGRERPDFVLMDVRLNGPRDGIDAAIEIWEKWGIRALFASANLDAAERARTEGIDPIGFLDKPFVGGALLALLPKTSK